ncbi:MAG TPA: ATP-grasp domain-containing protein [Bryobacteraceae bacterium]|nr:ATP-grasp domain-containing protein [Bryobacteraceae bacterium]
MKKRVLLFAATTGYQVRSFADAAARLEIDLALATDRCHILDDPWGDHAVPVSFDDTPVDVDALKQRGPFDGVVAVGDRPAVVAAQAAWSMGLRFSPPGAVRAAKSKFLARERFKKAGLLTPAYRLLEDGVEPTRYPSVLKPIGLSASRGVIRVDNRAEFVTALARIRALLDHETDRSIQVEDFIPGREFALEGLVTGGRLQVLALFDKPDPLDGPFFEETIYLTPSREPAAVQDAIVETTQRAVAALGLTHGPVHAEMRVNQAGVWMLEIAARPIGGLCSRVLKFDPEASLEEVILRHAIGEDVSEYRLASGAHGVMMIPIPRAGVYTGINGLDLARATAGIEDVVISAKEGQMMVPLPEGASYLGFIFARGGTSQQVDAALRECHSMLEFKLVTSLPVVS